MKILIGEISSYKAIALSRYIRKSYPNYLLYTYDYQKFTKFIKTRYSSHHFRIDKTNYLNEIKEIIDKYNINYFFPVINDTLAVFWRNKHELKDSLDYLGAFSTYEKLNNKATLHKIASELGIRVPTIYKDLALAKPPIVVKPKNLSSAKGVRYIMNDDAKCKEEFYQDTIIQEYIEGVGDGYSFYCKDGFIVNGYGHKRLSEYPVSGGSSTYREEYLNAEMHEIASRVVRHLKYTGFAMFEFKLTDNNKLYLIEVNPRIWGSVNQGLINNNNYFEQILGPGYIDSSEQLTNIKTYISPLIYLSLLMYLLKFNIKPTLYFIKNIHNNKADISIFDDPLGFFSTILRRIV